MTTLTRFEKGVMLLCVLVLAFFAYGTFIFLRDAPVPSHFAPMVIPGPQIFVRVPQYVDRIPGANGRPIDNGMSEANRYFRHKRTSGCDAECRAYRKAYANARLANKLLGEHRYREHA